MSMCGPPFSRHFRSAFGRGLRAHWHSPNVLDPCASAEEVEHGEIRYASDESGYPQQSPSISGAEGVARPNQEDAEVDIEATQA